MSNADEWQDFESFSMKAIDPGQLREGAKSTG
jgi:hypothetical protein